MFDLVALAYQANLTRVLTFMMAAEVSDQTYNHIGVPDAFHPLSHHDNDPAKMERLAKIQRYHTRGVRASSRQARGDARWRRHHARPLDPAVRQQHEQQQRAQPLSAADGARRGGCGRMQGGQHISFTDRTPLANVLLTLLDNVRRARESPGRQHRLHRGDLSLAATLAVASRLLAALLWRLRCYCHRQCQPSGSVDVRGAGGARRSNRRAPGSCWPAKADVNSTDDDGTTALHWAVHYGYTDLVDLLLKGGRRAPRE